MSNVASSSLVPAHLEAAGRDVGLLLLRAVVATVFVFHGGQKLFGLWNGPGIDGTAAFFAQVGIPWPLANAYVASVTEFFGGLAIGLGLLTRLVALPLAFTMVVAIVTVHPGGFSVREGGMEFALLLGVATLALAFTGPGRLSVDRLLLPRLLVRREIEPALRPVVA
jgi:putative oxidoreductase